MACFRRVEGNQAGSRALGILVPPGRRTLLIVRPRALEWDLLPLGPESGNGNPFREVDRDLAPAMAREVLEAMESSATEACGRVEPLDCGEGYQVRAALGSFVFVACRREPGRPYQPALFSTVEESLRSAQHIADFVCPAPNAEQEVYINDRNFAR